MSFNGRKLINIVNRSINVYAIGTNYTVYNSSSSTYLNNNINTYFINVESYGSYIIGLIDAAAIELQQIKDEVISPLTDVFSWFPLIVLIVIGMVVLSLVQGLRNGESNIISLDNIPRLLIVLLTGGLVIIIAFIIINAI